jgi:hypothetical protein
MVDIPNDVKNALNAALTKHSQTSNNNQEGLTRNKGLINKGKTSYQQLKRIKNWFDNYQGPKDSKEYELNGGDKMKEWVDTILGQMRNGVLTSTQMRKEYLPDKIKNSDFNVDLSNDNRPSQSHGNSLAKYNIDLNESLKRINEIISKI